MLYGVGPTCKLTGFVPAHALKCEEVAANMSCAILFREPGTSAQGLIAEGYAMKGFRIDAKSCNWGPMKGFVCVDPRLSKPNAEGKTYQPKNHKWTQEALDTHGHINTKFFAMPSDEERLSWVADTMPIVLSKGRIAELGLNGRYDSRGDMVGVSSQEFKDIGQVSLPWRLVPATRAPHTDRPKWLAGCSDDHYVLCVDHLAKGFQQLYPAGAEMVTFLGNETILGQCNPGTKERGFKACVTADYDLFSIWPSREDSMAGKHRLAGLTSQATMAAGVPRTSGVDTRLTKDGFMEHYRFGNVSPRILTAKVMLNTAIMSAGYEGGNAIHHNDECGNFGLAKGCLAECLPVVAFLPPLAFAYAGTCAVQTVADFGQLVREARESGYKVFAKPEWLEEAGVA
jgi:hypothetical protein